MLQYLYFFILFFLSINAVEYNTGCITFKTVLIKVCFSHIRDVFLVDSNRVSAATVASTAIAAAQWAVTQV